jgi:tetratricopeptide (TPR) repeat protein
LPRGPGRFLEELKQRGVLRTAGLYVVGAWLAIQVADTTFPHLQLPPWTVTAVIVAAIVGLPVVLALSWSFDLTPARFRNSERAEAADGRAQAGGTDARGRLVLTLVMLVLATTAGWLWLRRYAPPPQREDHVLVLPFQISGGSDFTYLGEGLVDLVARKLEGVAGLHASDPHTAIRIAQADVSGGGPIGAERARRLADQVGARHFILGTATEHGGRLALSARLYDVTSARDPPEMVSVEGDALALFELVDRLASLLLVSRFGAASAQLTRSAARTTTSAEALKQFLRAEQALRGARYDSAVAGFQRALTEDTAFALAHYRLAVAAVLNHTPRVAGDAIRRARSLQSGLGARDRELLDAFASVHAGRADEAEEAYRAILERYPDDLEARVQLGGLLALYNPLRGRPAMEAQAHLARVSTLDPAYLCPICTMVNLVLLEGDVDAADSLMSVRYPGSTLVTYHAGAAAARRDAAALEALLADVTMPAFWQASWVAAFFGNYDDAELLLTRPRPLGELTQRSRAVVHLTLADLHAARLRWRSAREHLRQAERVAPRRAALRRAYHTLLPFVETPPAEVEAVRAELARWRPERESPQAEAMMFEEFLPCLRSYLLGLAHTRLGDSGAALAEAAQLDELAQTMEARSLVQDLALTIRSEVELSRDEPERALAYIEAMRAEVPIAVMDAVAAGPGRDELADLLTLDHARFLRVRTLLQLGRHEDALRWADNGFFRLGGNPLYAPALDLARAEAHEALGVANRARQLYARYLAATGNADAELRASPDHARERLNRLAGTVR